MQEVPQGNKESAGGPWVFCGLLPLFDPPRHDSADTIRRALNLGVNVKMITGFCNHSLSVCEIYNQRISVSRSQLLDSRNKWSVDQHILHRYCR